MLTMGSSALFWLVLCLPTGSYTQVCPSNCEACTGYGTNKCTKCNPGYYLPYDTSGTCARCQLNCLRCSSSLIGEDDCSKCESGYAPENGICKKMASSSLGTVIGSIIGAVVLIALIVVLSYCCCCRGTAVRNSQTTVISMGGPQQPGNHVVIGAGVYGAQPLVISSNNMAQAQFYQQPQQVYYAPQGGPGYPMQFQQQQPQPQPQMPPALDTIQLQQDPNNPQNAKSNDMRL